MHCTFPRATVKAVVAALAGGVGGVALAALAVVGSETISPIPWGLMLWGGPVGFGVGATVGLAIWSLTRFLMNLPAIRGSVTSLGLCVVPTAIGAAAGYATFEGAHAMAGAATMIGGVLGLVCGAAEAMAGRISE